MEGFIVDRRACELGLETGVFVGDFFYGRWGRVRWLVAIDVGRGAAGVFFFYFGGLGLQWVRVLACTKGFPDAGGVKFGIFDLLEGLGGWGVLVAVWLGLEGCINSELPLCQGRRRLCRLRGESRQLTGCRRSGWVVCMEGQLSEIMFTGWCVCSTL